MLICTSFIAPGPSENLSYALLNFLTRIFDRFLGDLLMKLEMNFISISPRNLSKIRIKKLSNVYARLSEGPGAINDVQSNITSLLLVFNKNVVFRQQMLFFHSNLDFYLNECTETWKINTCCRKTTFLLKMSNNDAMLLPASNIASCACVDDSNQHPSRILRFSKNLDFWQILKMNFELHICCN